MKKRRIRILALAGALVFALGLGACGQQGGGGTNPPTPGPSVKIVEDIEIKVTPKTDYLVGEEFSIAGGIIKLIYEDGTTGEVGFNDSKVTITAPDMSTAGTKTVIVDYDGFQAQYQITVRNQTYTVTFDLNYSGAPSMTPAQVEPNGLLAKPADPSRTDYRFEGWFTDQACTQEFDFAETHITGNLTLYAKWVQELSVTFNLYDGVSPTKITVALNDVISIFDAPSVLREGYEFQGWFNGDTRYNFNTPITTSVNLMAKWQAIPAGTEARKVTINYNDGNASHKIEYYVANGSTTFQPNDVVAEGKEFKGWFKAATGSEQFDFTAQITADTEIFAQYIVDHYVINYKYVINGEEVIFRTRNVNPGAKATKIAQKPSVADYEFHQGVWYSDKACTQLFDFDTEINQDYDLYTKALKKNVFESEYTNIDPNKPGVGSSDSFNGLKLIFEDNGTAGSSNGYWVSGLYYSGAFVEFVIYSEKEVNDAILNMHLSVEWADQYIAPEETTIGGQAYHAWEIATYKAVMDGDAVKKTADGYAYYDADTKKTVDYQPIALEGAIPFSVSPYDKRPFSLHSMTSEFNLYKGYNVIRLTTINSYPPYDGTMMASAPMIDDLIIYTESELSWTPKTDNVSDWQAINFAPNKH